MKTVRPDAHFPTIETDVLEFWKKSSIQEKGLQANKGKQAFVFYDGPPFATGLPHYGHILPGTLKDIVPRYWVMKGKYVERRWGWDCHGLPVEFEMEKELGLTGLRDIEKFGIAKFNEACRQIVLRYTAEWQKTIERTGRWVDFQNAYRTMDPSYMETVWWVIGELWKKDLIYEGYRVMPYSWRISTPLSNFEANLNYKMTQDPALTVRFRSKKDPKRYFLAWTTTPWTLPSNLALAVHESLPYVEVKDKQGDTYVLAEALVPSVFKKSEEIEVGKPFPGKKLEGEKYEPLFDYFRSLEKKSAFQIVLGHHVTVADGTGIVHMAPAFGEDDYAICQRYGIPTVNPVDEAGNFTPEVKDYEGQNVKEADKNIIRDLKKQGSIFHQATIEHSYPFCWRSDTPLIYRAISTWFVRVEKIRDELVKHNQKTHWVPEHIRDGRFGKWLENARDWNISRNRFWGTPIPVWKCQGEKCEERVCLGSREELEKLTGKKVPDLHKHFVDELTFPCTKCKKPMKRIPEVLDCWFESGSMPYGQKHYPFENKAEFERTFPADFIAEGLDQTRGWFYTLTVLGNILFGKAPFKNVIVNGMVLAEDGKKMSKRLKNYPEPTEILEKYGADALRAYLTVSPAARADELRFSETGVKEIIRSVLLPLWNAHGFFVTYALADKWDPSRDWNRARLDKLDNPLDRWVVSRLQSLIRLVDEKMAVYHLYEVIPGVLGFIEELTNWYIRLNRRRFWKESGKDADKEHAYHTLYFVLQEFAKVLAPILPFITEEIYRNLRLTKDPESVHLCAFPEVNPKWIDRELETKMALVRSVVEMGRNLRNTHKIKTRQPLSEALVITRSPDDKQTIEAFQSILTSELNIKRVKFSSDESSWVRCTAKANARVLGPKLGTRMKEMMEEIRNLSPELVAEFEKKGKLALKGITLEKDDLTIERSPLKPGVIQTEGGITLWLDTTLDDGLVREGQARELVNRIQKLRKDTGLEVTDRIRVFYDCPEALEPAIQAHRDYISNETLAVSLERAKRGAAVDQTIDDLPIQLAVEKT